MQNLQRSFSQGSLLAGTLTYNIYKNTKKSKTKVRIRYQLSTISNAFPCITNRLKPFKHTQTRSMESFMIGETIEELSVRVKAGY